MRLCVCCQNKKIYSKDVITIRTFYTERQTHIAPIIKLCIPWLCDILTQNEQ